jgi:hypothetical protein
VNAKEAINSYVQINTKAISDCHQHAGSHTRPGSCSLRGPLGPARVLYLFICALLNHAVAVSDYSVSSILLDITPCSLWSVNRRFGGTYRLHLQCRKITWARNQHERCKAAFRLVSFSAYFLDPEEGGDMLLRTVGWHSTGYTALYVLY